MSEEVSRNALLPIARDLYLKAAFNDSLLVQAENMQKSKAEILEQIAEDFTLFVLHLEKRLSRKD